MSEQINEQPEDLSTITTEAVSPAMEGQESDEITYEYYDYTGVTEKLESASGLSEFLRERIDRARKDCEIQETPETAEALIGYYRDHYALAEIIDTAISGDITDEQLDDILSTDEGSIKNEDLPKRVKDMVEGGYSRGAPSAESAVKLIAASVVNERSVKSEEERLKAHKATLRFVNEFLTHVLFQESALGITTISEDEVQIVIGLWQKLSQNLDDTGTTYNPKTNTITWPGGVGGRQSFSLGEAVAGIQEKKDRFWQDCRYAGQLEFHNTGFMGDVSLSAGLMPRTEQFRERGSMNAQTAASESMHSVAPHFSERYDPLSYKTGGPEKMSGRGTVAVALADILRVAPFARDARYGIVTPSRRSTMEKIPLPTLDGVTSIGFGHFDYEGSDGGDRVFFASSTQYEGQAPDDYSIHLDNRTTFIFFGDQEIESSQRFGLGESFPDRLHIEEGDDVDEKIKEVQLDYLSRSSYKDRIIVPLRRGIFDFRDEGMHKDYGRREPNYNKNPTLAAAA